jgi:MOSC domain-containing protein YiiM
MTGAVVAVGAARSHGLTKQAATAIELQVGFGVTGDAHCGNRVKHRSRARADPTPPNLRQVHLLPAELLDDLLMQGFAVAPIVLGENVTTRGIDLIALPLGTRLRLGDTAQVELTGLRNPCIQLERLMPGLMAACLGRDGAGELIRKTGVMAIVVTGGTVHAGDTIVVDLPPRAHIPLRPV